MYHAHLVGKATTSAAAESIVEIFSMSTIEREDSHSAWILLSINIEHSIALRKKNGWFYTRMRMAYTMLTHMHISTHSCSDIELSKTNTYGKRFIFGFSHCRMLEQNRHQIDSQWLPENRLKWYKFVVFRIFWLINW